MAVSQQQAAAALQKAGVSVFNLQIEDTGASVALRGTVSSEAERRKAEQALRQATDTEVANYLEVQGGADAAAGETYTVKSGDTLRKIAKNFYGDEMKWHAIRDANPELAANPDKIQVGQQITIPSA
jgi:nucleoid-associated protein YgaU